MQAFYANDGVVYPPRGAQGGGDAAAQEPFLRDASGHEHAVPAIGSVTMTVGETLGHRLSGGGGYGDPREREPELVRQDVLSRFVSLERARDVYGVVFTHTTLDDGLEVDVDATRDLRERARAATHG